MSWKLTRRRNGAALWGAALLCGLQAAPARAEEGPTQCLQAYEDAQVLRRQGDLVKSAQQLLTCGGPACPVRMQSDCQRWSDEVQRSLPTVVFRVRDAQNHTLTHATLAIDDTPARPLDGRALPLNPGQHVVVFAHPGYAPLRTPVFITEGEKLEPHDVTLTALSEPALAPTESALPLVAADAQLQSEPAAAAGRNWTGPVVAGAVAVLGGVGLAYFGSSARKGENDLDHCTPDCSQSSVDAVKSDYLMANVSLGVGIAALLGAGLMLLLDEPGGAAANGSSRANAPRTGAVLGVVRF